MAVIETERLTKFYGPHRGVVELDLNDDERGKLREAAEGIRAKLLVPTLLYPVAEDVYREFFEGVTRGLVVELSFQGQLYRILRMYADVPKGVVSFARSGGRAFRPGEVLAKVRELVHDHVIDQRRRRLYQPPVDQNMPVRMTAAPSSAGAGQAQRRHGHAERACKVRGAQLEPELR